MCVRQILKFNYLSRKVLTRAIALLMDRVTFHPLFSYVVIEQAIGANDYQCKWPPWNHLWPIAIGSSAHQLCCMKNVVILTDRWWNSKYVIPWVFFFRTLNIQVYSVGRILQPLQPPFHVIFPKRRLSVLFNSNSLHSSSQNWKSPPRFFLISHSVNLRFLLSNQFYLCVFCNSEYRYSSIQLLGWLGVQQ